MAPEIINFCYIVAATLFVFGIKMLGSVKTARRGNFISAFGMLIAVVATLLKQGMDYTWIFSGLLIGAGIGALVARKVQMTGMPELVALFNGFGGLASLLIGWAEYVRIEQVGWSIHLTGVSPLFTSSVLYLAILIGGVTFSGSFIAYLKLSGKLGGRPTLFRGQTMLNAFVGLIVLGLGLFFVVQYQGSWALEALMFGISFALILGVLSVLPIGGGDMPVVIALLNSFSGLAATAAGFVLINNVLIVAGSLVGASGLILTFIMCKAMNRNLVNVLFGGFGASVSSGGDQVEGEMKAISAEDAYYVLEAASSVIFVPGYGMAVAQAQHAVKELGAILQEKGCDVRYVIHPVAGRMPGHMNVLLAEADIPYDQLFEMDTVNPTISTVDVAVVIGANDVVNPAATQDQSSPIYGMPIVNVHEAKNVFVLKRGQGVGFSGLANKLFFMPNTRMLYGDAKATLTQLVAQFKES